MAQGQLHGAVVDIQLDLQIYRGSFFVCQHRKRTLGRITRAVRIMQQTDAISDPAGDFYSDPRELNNLPVLYKAKKNSGMN